MLTHENRLRRREGKDIIRDVHRSESPRFTQRSLPAHEHIRQRAHEIYLRRNGLPGNPVLDWLQAELELGAAMKEARVND